jgi:hypothetical protein
MSQCDVSLEGSPCLYPNNDCIVNRKKSLDACRYEIRTQRGRLSGTDPYDARLDYFRMDNSPGTSSLRFPESPLRRYRRPIRDPLGGRMRCIFKDANCFELCHLPSGRASSWDGTNSA